MKRIREIKSLSQKQISEKTELIEELFVGIPIISGKGGYPYSLFSLTDFSPAMRPGLIEDMADLIVYYGDFEHADLLVSEADRGGGPLTHAVAVRTNLPYTLANWYPNETPGEVSVEARVGFSGEGNIYLNGVSKGQRAFLVDDLLSSGGTALALLKAIHKAGAIITGAAFVAEKINIGGRRNIKEEFDIPIKTLVQFIAEGDYTTAAGNSRS